MSTEQPAVAGMEHEDIAILVNGSRTYSQFLDMLDKIRNGICPFCPQNFDAEKNEELASAGEGSAGWRLWRNPYPLAHTSDHLVLAPVRHISHLKDMQRADWLCVGQLMTANTIVNAPGGGLVWRFGDPAYHAGSIRHLHANIIIPNREGEVRPPLAKDPTKQNEAQRRVVAFEKLRRAGVSADDASTEAPNILREEELKLVRDRV